MKNRTPKPKAAPRRFLDWLVRWLWIRKNRHARGKFVSTNGDQLECLVVNLDDCPFMDDAIIVDYRLARGCWVRGATISRSNFQPNVLGETRMPRSGIRCLDRFVGPFSLCLSPR